MATRELAAIALMVGLIAPADARCYSRWFYKTPQHCANGPRTAIRAFKAQVPYLMPVTIRKPPAAVPVAPRGIVDIPLASPDPAVILLEQLLAQ